MNHDITRKAKVNLAAIARSHSDAAINTIVAIMNDAGGAATDRLKAASIILDRGHGRAVNINVDSDFETQFGDLSESELNERAREIIGTFQNFSGIAQAQGKTVVH